MIMSWKSVTQPTVWGAKSSRQMRNMRYAKKAIHVGSFFVPGLGTYKAAKAGHKLLFGVNLVGDVTLAAWLWQQINAPSDAITESTPKSLNDLSPWIQTPEYQYQHIVGYEDHGPVHWTRTV